MASKENSPESKTESTSSENNMRTVQGASRDIDDPAESAEKDEEVQDPEAISPIVALEQEVLQLKEELAESKDRQLRTIAEMENMSKRLDRERSDMMKYGHENVMRDLIPVLDSFDKAIPKSDENISEETKSYLEGMRLVAKQLQQVLANHGLNKIDAVGQEFDPNVHQAVQKVDVESDENQERVLDDYATGYKLHDRLLRASMVSVAVPVPKSETPDNKSNS